MAAPAITPARPRYLLPDLLRTVALILMLIFHTCFDLRYFRVWDLSKAAPFIWHYLPNLIVGLFFCAVGLSLCLAYPQKVNWPKFGRRLAQIAAGAALISIVTYWYYPAGWIYFGTLHCIVFISLVALPLRKFPKTCLVLAIIILVAEVGWEVPWPWFYVDNDSLDYIPPLPWISASFIGIWIYGQGWHCWPAVGLADGLKKGIHLIGRHTLLIYLLHQPVIFGLGYFLFNRSK